jgi:hypothetical protein
MSNIALVNIDFRDSRGWDQIFHLQSPDLILKGGWVCSKEMPTAIEGVEDASDLDAFWAALEKGAAAASVHVGVVVLAAAATAYVALEQISRL